jgi:hypothetical protein
MALSYRLAVGIQLALDKVVIGVVDHGLFPVQAAAAAGAAVPVLGGLERALFTLVFVQAHDRFSE